MHDLPFTDVITTIELIRDSFEGSEIVYTKGSCVKFAMILKHLYPSGTIMYDLSHAIFKYGERYFDITGEVNCTPNHIPIEDYGILQAYKSMNLKYSIKK